jgi:hypothetical protein
LQWGGPTFNAGDIFAMIAASIVAIVEVCFNLSIFINIVCGWLLYIFGYNDHKSKC